MRPSTAPTSKSRAATGGSSGAAGWLVAYAIDWHGEMSAVTLPALIVAGALIAASDASGHAASREPT
jgi:hypothetical protein